VIINTWNSETLPLLPESAQVAADFWRKELNLDVEIRVGESASTRQAYRAGDLQGQILWRENETKVDGMGSTRTYFGRPGPVMTFHQDPELFKLVQETMAVFEPEAREKAINDLHKVLWELNHVIGIGYVNVPWGVGPRIKEWRPRPLSQQATGLYTMTVK
jgi:ABC-type transport system substrate-binding protein